MPILSCQNILRFLPLFCVFFVSEVHAQAKLDCTPFNSVGCHSFNELVGAGDADIVGKIKSSGRAARVCFAEYEDNFSIIAFGVPSETDWHKRKDGVSYASRPMFSSFTRYKDGVEFESHLLRITWEKIGDDGDWYAEGTGPTRESSHLIISPDEINFTVKWTNKASTITTFQFSMRVATGRFKETYDYKDAKGKPISIDATGHCVRYQDGAPEIPRL